MSWESFLLKLKTITTSFEHNVFHSNLKQNIKGKSILTNISDCYQNRNSSQTFRGDNITSKSFNKLFLIKSLLIQEMTIIYRPELYYTPLQMILWGCFERAAPKFLGNCKKNVCGGVLFRVARIKSTAYYQTALQIHSASVQKGKDILQFWKFQQHLCETIPFYSNATALISANKDSKKNVSFEYSETVESLPKKGL